ncbi:MAG: hypothetical protein ACRCZF_25035, partial [Gemmataceae bacterium]
MTGTRNEQPHGRMAALERRWRSDTQGPNEFSNAALATGPLELCVRLKEVCIDITRRCPEYAHIDPRRILVSYTPSRNRSRYGLQARV